MDISRPLETDDQRLLFLALNRISFLGPKRKMELVGKLDSPGELLALSRAGLEGLLGRRVFSRRWNPARLLEEAQADRRHLTAAGIGCTFYPDPGFPALLREIDDPPILLYIRGRLPRTDRPWVAVVGTRRPSGSARRGAYELGGGLSRLGAVTVSGLALGIDGEAHRGSVDAGGITVAVLGNGIDSVYPRSRERLARRILLGGGAVISEYPPGTPPFARQFPARNRIISGLCRTVVVVEAPLRSGALITADFALQEGRELFVHAGGLRGAAGEGTRRLADDGAPVIGGAVELAAALGWEPVQAPPCAGRQAPPACSGQGCPTCRRSQGGREAAGGQGGRQSRRREAEGRERPAGQELARLLELELAWRRQTAGRNL